MSRLPERRPLTEDEQRVIAALQAGTCPDCGSELVNFKRARSTEGPAGVIVSGGCGAHGLWELFGDPATSYRVSTNR